MTDNERSLLLRIAAIVGQKDPCWYQIRELIRRIRAERQDHQPAEEDPA